MATYKILGTPMWHTSCPNFVAGCILVLNNIVRVKIKNSSYIYRMSYDKFLASLVLPKVQNCDQQHTSYLN